MIQHCLHAMSGVPHGARLCVGLSGGVDSVVLLDMLAVLAPRRGWRLSAMHVPMPTGGQGFAASCAAQSAYRCAWSK
jgi:tRNA(Ile)-lysidine synthase TilS/MesJ